MVFRLIRCVGMGLLLASLAIPVQAAEPRRVTGSVVENDLPVAGRLLRRIVELLQQPEKL